jgi:hypothetical protein
MTVSATLRLESPALGSAVGHAADTDVTVEERSMTAEGRLDATVQARGTDIGSFEEGLDADATVSRWVPVGGADTRRLYRVRFTEETSATMHYDGWADGQAVFPSVERTARDWVVEAIMPDRTVLQEFAENCKSEGVQLDLVRIGETDRLGGAQQYGLTDLQAETLLKALDWGYYDVPREANLEEMSERFDVSHQALSERVRRGLASLIENTVASQWNDGESGESRESPASEAEPGTDVVSEESSLERSVAFSL